MNLPFVQAITIGFAVFIAILLTTPTSGQQNEEDGKANDKPEEKKKVNFTGNPQIDYVYDPNLPRELGNYDLSDYPFYNRLPEDVVNFTCNDRYDGFYASIPHKCQVYHNCLFGQRYSFVCANYTAFDQVTLNCHFANKVQCEKSHELYDLNAKLYIEPTSTTEKYIPYRQRFGISKPRRRKNNRNRNKQTTTTTTQDPLLDDYYYYEDYEDHEVAQNAEPEYADDYYYYDYPEKVTTPAPTPPPRRRPQRPLRPTAVKRPARIRVPPSQEIETAQIEEPSQIRSPILRTRRPGNTNSRPASKAKKRRIKKKRRKSTPKPTTTTTTTTTTTESPAEDYEYYYYYYYDEDEEATTTSTTTTTTTPSPRRAPVRRRRPIRQRVGGRQPVNVRQNVASKSLPVEQTQVNQSPSEPVVRSFRRAPPYEDDLLHQGSASRRNLEAPLIKGRPLRSGVFRRPLR